MKKTYHLKITAALITAILIIITSCTDEFADKQQTVQLNDRTITLRATMPQDNPSTRIALEENEGSLNLIAKWMEDDVIQLFYVQGETKAEGIESAVFNISGDSKTSSFNITVPEEINLNEPFDLYAFCGIPGYGVQLTDGEIVVDITPVKSTTLDNFSVPVWTKVEAVSLLTAEVELAFNHLGAYEVIHLKNESSQNLEVSESYLIPKDYNSPLWYYHTDDENSPVFNPVSGVITSIQEDPVSQSAADIVIEPGTVKTIVSWYVPNEENIPNLKLKINDSNSANFNKEKSFGMKAGRAYHIYAAWDGAEAEITFDPNIPDNFQGTEEEFIESIVNNLNLQIAASVVYEDTYQESGNSFEALSATAEWLAEKDEVAKIELHNTDMLIQYDNGIKMVFSTNLLDKNGKPIFRGGGGGSELTQYSFARKNNPETFQMGEEVLIFNAFADEFYDDNYPFMAKFSDAAASVNVTVLNNEEANLASLQTFKDYSFIILNTHGLPWGIRVRQPDYFERYVPTTEPVISRALVMEYFGLVVTPGMEQEVYFGTVAERAAVVDGQRGTIVELLVMPTLKHIRTLGLDNAVVFGNFCYSGSSKSPVKSDRDINMVDAWKNAGAATYYGYAFDDEVSMPVGQPFAIEMEEALLNRFVQNGDSTGIAHLNSQNKEYSDTTSFPHLYTENHIKKEYSRKIVFEGIYPTDNHGDFKFKQFDEVRYRYGCGVLDDFTDSRDGQTYKLVCIGNRVWFAENLRYLGAGRDFSGNPNNRAIYGRYYTKEEAMEGEYSNNGESIRGVCPEGWHIPSRQEYLEFIDWANEKGDPWNSLRSVTTWNAGPGTDRFGFNLKASGGINLNNYPNIVETDGRGAALWTTTLLSGIGGPSSDYVYFNFSMNELTKKPMSVGGTSDKIAWPIRCIQD